MSVRALTWALEQRAGDPTCKVILMVLADHANENGECWPSIPRIAQLAETTDRTVRRRLKDLEARGLVARTDRYRENGSQASTMYALAMDGQATPPDKLSPPGGTPCQGAPDAGDSPPLSPVSPPIEPSLEPSERNSRSAREEIEPEDETDPLEQLPRITKASIRGLYGGPGRSGTDERVWGDVLDPELRERLLRTALLRWLGEGHGRFQSLLFRRILEAVIADATQTGGGARASPSRSKARTYYDDPLPEELEEESL